MFCTSLLLCLLECSGSLQSPQCSCEPHHHPAHVQKWSMNPYIPNTWHSHRYSCNTDVPHQCRSVSPAPETWLLSPCCHSRHTACLSEENGILVCLSGGFVINTSKCRSSGEQAKYVSFTNFLEMRDVTVTKHPSPIVAGLSSAQTEWLVMELLPDTACRTVFYDLSLFTWHTGAAWR